MGQPVVHFEVIGKDAERLQSYYSELFGWEIDADNPMRYVEVPDVEAALAKAERLGGSRMMGPEQVMEQVEIGLFSDPEGHLIGVVKSGS
jgi:hypothetical protein